MSQVVDPPVLLQVENLSISIPGEQGLVNLVRDVSFSVEAGEIVGVVGESGSGKSLSALAMMRLLDRTAVVRGRVLLNGVDLLVLSEKAMRKVRGSRITMAFQEPMTALDPVFTIGQQLAATLRAHRRVSRAEAFAAAVKMLSRVGIPLPERRAQEYPHQLSGGMRQRVMVAMAMICEPDVLIADEPTTAVDVTIQAQILDLIRELTSETGTAVLFISHDLGVITELCSRVVTLYAGEVVETGLVSEVMGAPSHPYTSALLQSTPRIETRHLPLRAIPGRLPQPGSVKRGCLFEARCQFSQDRCRLDDQELAQVSPDGRLARCWRSSELNLEGVSS